MNNTVNYQIKKVHGLPLVCWKRNKKYVTEEEAKEMLKKYFSFNSFVSYKGGDIERDILHEFGVKCINLEVIGCDKYDVLLTHLFHPKALTSYVCDEHTPISGCHCSRYEVVLFYLWIDSVKYKRNCVDFYNSIMKK